MALVKRNGRTYVYHSVRNGDKVTSRYGGFGENAEWFEGVEKQVRILASLKRAKRAATEAKVRRRLERREKQVAETFNAVEETLEALLIAAGFHRPNRGPWRRKRVQRTD